MAAMCAHAFGALAASPPPTLIVLAGATAHLGDGRAVARATIVIRGGVIEAVRPGLPIPPGAHVIDGTGLNVYPGLIDALTNHGLKRPPATPDGTQADTPPGPQFAHVKAADLIGDEDRAVASWREAGVLTLNVAPDRGIFMGQSAVVNLNGGSPAQMLARSPSAMQLSLRGLGYRNRVPGMAEPGGEFPTRLIGIFGFIRQTLLDVQHLDQSQTIMAGRPAVFGRPERDRSLEALLPVVRRTLPIVVPGKEEREVQRVLDLADDYKLNVILAGGYEAAVLGPALKQRNIPVLVSLGFPEREKDVHPGYVEPVEYLRYRVHAPKAAGELVRAGVRIAFYSDGLRSGREFLYNLRRAVREGLPKEAALRAATLTAAEILGVSTQLGSLATGKTANLVVTDGDLFADATRITMVLVGGRHYDVPRPKGTAALPPPAPVAEPVAAAAERASKAAAPRDLVIRNANVMTVSHGTLTATSILVRGGTIAAIGPAVAAPPGADVLDASGMWITPGFIDCHSHIATDSHNESGANITSMTGIYDVINPKDIAVYRTLAAGVTTANTMHGSVNAIGGKTVVTKTRFGRPVPEFVFKGARPGLKFAVKEFAARRGPTPPASWMEMEAFLREALDRARTYAREWDDYLEARKKPGAPLLSLPPRRDLTLEPLVEAMRGERIVHVHSYTVQEMLLVMRVAEAFGFRVVLQHATEAYRIADEIKTHNGGGASIFADLAGGGEMIGIYNAVLLTKKGVPVSINSDGEELARHFNQDAARARAMGLSEDEALALVTLNPARQLRIENQVGSIDVGKHADLVLFDKYPLSVYAVPQRVYIDGELFFSREKEAERVRNARADLIRLKAIDEAESKRAGAFREAAR